MALEDKKEKFVYSLPKRDASNRYAAHKKTTLPPFANGTRAQAWQLEYSHIVHIIFLRRNDRMHILISLQKLVLC